MVGADAGAASARLALIASDQFATPDSIFKPLDEKYHFVLDLSATKENAKCADFFDLEADALSRSWIATALRLAKSTADECWMWNNPPYSKPNLGLFTSKARAECELGAAIVQLVPATVDAAWFQDNVMAGADVVTKRTARGEGRADGFELVMTATGGIQITVRFLRRRITFSNPYRPTGGDSAKTGSMLIEWKPKRLL